MRSGFTTESFTPASKETEHTQKSWNPSCDINMAQTRLALSLQGHYSRSGWFNAHSHPSTATFSGFHRNFHSYSWRELWLKLISYKGEIKETTRNCKLWITEQPHSVHHPLLSSHPSICFPFFFKHFPCPVILLSPHSSQTIRVCNHSSYTQTLLKLQI